MNCLWSKIHAGGYSQRMPPCSMLGKIFYTIPCESACINDMLDMKLAIYTPFAINMSPGIFLTSSDDIESFNLQEQLSISKFFKANLSDFILIAHKSSLEVAKDHGCYSLGNRIEYDEFKRTEINACKFVLQKPAIETMNSSNIICKHPDGTAYVYTDSVFYFTHNVIEELLHYSQKYYEDFVRLNIELDAYKDFLQPLGTHRLSLGAYLKISRSNYSAESHGLIFGELYKTLNKKRAHVITLEKSNFYHLGTINELFDSYMAQDDMSTEFRKQICFCKSKNTIPSICNADTVLLKSHVEGGSSVVIQPNCLIEYCDLRVEDGVQFEIMANCYLNNCVFDTSDAKPDDTVVRIPPSTCIHTIGINEGSATKYVSVCFSRNDDLKKTYPARESIVFLGRTINSLNVELSPSSCSIWNLRIFPSATTPSKSFYECTKLIDAYLQNKLDEYLISKRSQAFYSLFDLLSVCNYDEMIEMRERFDSINENY
jgi:hypothetical protein